MSSIQGEEYQEEGWSEDGTQPKVSPAPVEVPETGQNEKTGVMSKLGSLPVAKIGIAICVLVGIVILFIVGKSFIGRFSSESKEEKEPENEIPAWMQEDYEIPEFKYTAEEVAELRLNGYTGSEIENYQVTETPAEQLIKKAKEQRQKLYDEEVAPYMDSASKEYKELAANSWVGQPALEYDKDVSGFTYYSKTMNVDFEKLPARGNQLYIKLITDAGMILFMNVSPEQYSRLASSGNIVVNVDYTRTRDGKDIITGITEVKITQ